MNTADLRMGESKLNTNHSKFPKNPLLLVPKTTVHAYNGLEVVFICPTSSSPASASPTTTRRHLPLPTIPKRHKSISFLINDL